MSMFSTKKEQKSAMVCLKVSTRTMFYTRCMTSQNLQWSSHSKVKTSQPFFELIPLTVSV